jgi:hypothetical protein
MKRVSLVMSADGNTAFFGHFDRHEVFFRFLCSYPNAKLTIAVSYLSCEWRSQTFSGPVAEWSTCRLGPGVDLINPIRP